MQKKENRNIELHTKKPHDSKATLQFKRNGNDNSQRNMKSYVH